MIGQARLFGIHEVRWQQQQAVGALGFRGARELGGDGGAVAAACDHGYTAFGLRDGRADHGADFIGGQREEFAGAASGEHAGDVVLQ